MKENQVVRILGNLNGSVDEIDRVLATGNCDLQIDFSACPKVAVEGLEWLEEMLMRANSLQSEIVFVNVPPVVYKVFKVAHIDSILEACGSPRPSSTSQPVC
jgi:hypothetical protein